MQTQTSQIVEQAISKQEAEEAGIVADDKKPEGGEDDKPKETGAKDASASKPKSGEGADDKPKYDKDGKRIEVPKPDEAEVGEDGKPLEKPDDKPEEGKFTADDALEVEKPKDADKPEAPTDAAGIQLSPAERKHIVDNIGEPIVIRGVRGEGDAAKEVEIKVYSPTDIPADFKFANDQQRTAAATAFYNIEQKANKLLGEFRQNQSQTAASDFERRENEGIRADVADLQKDGKFPKFSKRPGESGFDDTPEAKQMSEVLGVMTERNELYLKQYSQGRPYKHIGFSEAFDIWQSRQTAKADTAKKDDAQKKEDEERRERGAESGSSNRGMNPLNVVKPTVRSGTTTRDILNRIDAEDF